MIELNNNNNNNNIDIHQHDLDQVSQANFKADIPYQNLYKSFKLYGLFNTK
jgi:hypothetical protein